MWNITFESNILLKNPVSVWFYKDAWEIISNHCDFCSFKLEAQGWKPVINKHLKDHQLCFMLYADEKQKHFCVELIWSQL